MNEHAIIHVDNVTKTYRERNALTHLTLNIKHGSRTVILGHNGAGKSTLLELIATLRTPTSGVVTVGGHNTTQSTRAASQLIGLTPQSNALDNLATVTEALSFHAAALGMRRKQAAERTSELLEQFGLAEHHTKRVSELSGGTRRKLDLAVALMARPPIIILDEPTTGLDPVSRLDFWKELTELNQAGTTLVVSTQDLHEAEVLATDIVVLKEGAVAAVGSPADLKEKVGARALRLVFPSEDHATALLEHSTSGFLRDPDNHHAVHLPLDGSTDVMSRAFADITAHAPAIEKMTIDEPTLDDVFLALAAK